MRLSWNGLWLLTLLLYTDVVNTSVSILNCPLLSDPDGTKIPICIVYSNICTGSEVDIFSAVNEILVICSVSAIQYL